MRNLRGEGTTDTTEIQTILSKYYEQLHANRLDNLEDVDKFLEADYLPKQIRKS